MGDFNLHISEDKEDPSDISTAIFMDTCEAMGLYQHVTFPTHKAGNLKFNQSQHHQPRPIHL